MIKQTQLTEEAIHNFMQAALLEGRKARPKCAPNPPVGCVIVKDNQIVARGHTNEPGQPHAEAMALNQLSPEIEDFTMFVTLEPCSFFGRTPSCAKRVAKTTCRAVYVAMIDPHKKNQGKGIEILKAAGIEVHLGVLQTEAEADLNPFLLKE